MNTYNEAYRNYYSGLRQNVNPRTKVYKTASVDELLYRNKKKKSKFNIGEILIKQLVGAIVLFVVAFTVKMIPSEEAKSAYAFSKNIVQTDFDYNNFIEYIKNFDVMEYINEIDLSA